MTIYPEFCPANHRCPAIRNCPTGAIEQIGYNPPSINQEKCTNCGKCINWCGLGVFAE